MTDNIATDFNGISSDSGGKSSNTTSKNLLIGRDKQVSQIVDYVKNNKSSSSSWLLTGESGIGKSAPLDEIYRRFTKEEEETYSTTPPL